MKRAVVAGMVAALVAVAQPAGAESPSAPYSEVYVMEVGEIKVGDPVPMFKAKGIFGREVVLEDLLKKDERVILAFWSKYCQACVEKFASLVAAQKKYGPRGLQVISLNTDGEYKKGEQEIRDFISEVERSEKIKITFPVLYDERNWVPHTMRIQFLPTIVAVDPQGRVFDFYQKFDEASQEEIHAGVDALIDRLYAAFPVGAAAGAPAAK